jgi:cell division protein FtsA
MARKQYTTAIDLGSSFVRIMIAESIDQGEEHLRIVGVGETTSFGMRKGQISDSDALAKSIADALSKAETMAGVSVSSAVVSIGGANVRMFSSKGVIAVGRADGEVTIEDIDRVIMGAGKTDIPLNYEVISIIPRRYRLDDQKDIRDPIGMQGVRLEVDALIVAGFSPQMKHIQTVLSACGIEIEQFVFAPLAAAESVLDRQQKELGSAVVDLGSMTTSVAVYEEGELLHCACHTLGSSHITNDIAIGLRTSIMLAEQVKLEYGTANITSIQRDEDIDLGVMDASEEGAVSRYHVGEIIEARLEEIFEQVNKELREADRERMLPAGIVLVGGGAKLPEIADVAKKILSLPVSLGYPRSLGGVVDKVDDPSYAVAAGLLLWQLREGGGGGFPLGGGGGSVADFFAWVRRWFKTFMP